MNKIYFLNILLLSLSLTSCSLFKSLSDTSSQASLGEVTNESLTKEDIQNRCISEKHTFRDDVDSNLYGLSCIEGAKIRIKTRAEGELFTTTTSAGENLRLEKEDENGQMQETESIPGVVNKYYKVKYEVLDNKENKKHPKWLKDLIAEDLDFYGIKGKKYLIVFKTLGNYLVLYKAVQDLDYLPFTERSALQRDKDGKYIADEEGYYMVPFIGYHIKGYCHLKHEKDDDTGRMRVFVEPYCEGVTKKDKPEFIKFDLNAKQIYSYARKKNIFPANYFLEGEWFYSRGDVETADATAHNYRTGSALVKLEPNETNLTLVDISGAKSEGNRLRAELFAVKWKEYERDCIDAVCDFEDDSINFTSFIERENLQKNTYEKRPYVKIIFPEGKEVNNIVMTENYFSYVLSNTRGNRRVKEKISLLKARKVNQSQFHEKRWFKEDQWHRFTLLPSYPEVEVGSSSEESANMKHYRQIHFNTNEDHTVIKWHFSNYTVKNNQDGINGTADDEDGDIYRELGKKAVEIYNRAFEIITKEYCASLGKEEDCKSITVEMADEGDKDLGDLRYNILNLVNARVLSNRNSLYGRAPSFVREDTGQIIGTTTNVFIHTMLQSHKRYIESYIRYEIFRNKGDYSDVSEDCGDSSPDGEREHVVSCYVRTKIKTRCRQGVGKFIREKKKDLARKALKRGDPLNDEIHLEQCSREISKELVLSIILHEMGHSFGLAHNFKASVDSENYYEDLEEVKTYFPNSDVFEETKSSSVMDYLSSNQPQMTVLGKYDLAVLRYLYLDHVENKSYEGYNKSEQDIERVFLNLKIPIEFEDQKPLSEKELSQIKSYQACIDALDSEITISTMFDIQRTGVLSVDAEEFLCIQHDYGSNPKEIVQNQIKALKRSLNDRYRYGREDVFMGAVGKILGFYNKWLDVRNEYLKSEGLLGEQFVAFDDESGLKEYRDDILEGGLIKGYSEYDLYYPVREPIANFVMDFVLLETMKCQVHKKGDENTAFFLDLESIKSKLPGGDSLYVEDCESDSVKTFLDNEDLVYMSQRGLENFYRYNFKKEGRELDVIPRDGILDHYFSTVVGINSKLGQTPPTMLSQPFANKSVLSFGDFLLEPDFLHSFMSRLEKGLGLNGNIKDISFRDVQYITGHILTARTMIERLKLGDLSGNTDKNSDSFNFLLFVSGTGAGSLYKQIQEPLDNGQPPAFVFQQRPFLMEVYKEYRVDQIETGSEAGFQTYVMEKYKDHILDLSERFQLLFIPIEKEGLSARMFTAYNNNHKRWEELNQKGDSATPLEQIERDNLNQINMLIYSLQMLYVQSDSEGA